MVSMDLHEKLNTNGPGIDVANHQPQYGDTKRSSEYTTENYKVELSNLPSRLQFPIVKNLIQRKFKLNPHKIRLGQEKVFLAFKNEEERDAAIAKLNDQEWKGRTLLARIASARDDPLAQKLQANRTPSKITDITVVGDEPITEDEINLKVCPLWGKTYEEQLQIKESIMLGVLKMSPQIRKMSNNLKNDAPKLYDWVRENEKISCRFDGLVASPVLTGYRNKCEFNISKDGDIGFKIGRYRDGSDRICRPPNNCPLLTEIMFQIIDLLGNYLKNNTKLKCFDMVSHEGHYRQLTIRSNSVEEYLTIVDLHPQSLSEEELKEEITSVVNTLKSIKQIVSIYFNISDICAFSSNQQSVRLVHGDDCLYETLSVEAERPLKFRIGPGSFFQVNSRGAELLYRAILDVAKLGPKSMVLDVGCGTGTIGLSLAGNVNHVIGIEIVREAIEDAKSNAKANNIKNVSFYAGKAEDLIGESITILKNKLVYQKSDGDIVAIVDPPRVGFNNSFIKTLRASSIKRIVYIACDPKANTNLTTLCRPTSKAYQGEPFVPVRAKAFDLFPHTKCCEILVVYERLSMVGVI